MDLKQIYPLPHHSPILEPELDVLLLQSGELVPVGQRVEVLRVARDEGLRRVRVGQEPLLQPRDLRHCGAYHQLQHRGEEEATLRLRKLLDSKRALTSRQRL